MSLEIRNLNGVVDRELYEWVRERSGRARPLLHGARDLELAADRG